MTDPRQGLPDLPVTAVLGELVAALAVGRPAILVAPPGAGKTTLAPLALLDAAWLDGRRIVMLEPRRLAARAAARRMAALLGDEVGGIVGYQTRDERRSSAATRIEVVTEGILTRRVQHDPELPAVAALIFDEVHERNLATDLGMALALDARSSLRPDLRIVAMSATPDVGALRRVLPDAIEITSEGRTFPVDVRWIPVTDRRRIQAAVADATVAAMRDDAGDALVFLPGIGEIRGVESALRGRLPEGIDVHPLAGSLSLAEQDRALAGSPPGRRRVVLTTDIAETSLTVEGIRIVIDSGLARAPRFDPRTGMSRLTTVSTSRASADQRAGRAGRVEPGVCYRLWSRIEHSTRLAHHQPEIEQVDLAGLALELAGWGGDPASMAFMTQPPTRPLQAARQLLAELGALDGERLTGAGRAMLAIPAHPRLARMLVAEPTPLAAILAVLVDERDVLRGRPDELPVDLAVRVRIVAGGEPHDLADRRAVAAVRDRAGDLCRRLGITADFGAVDADRAGAVLLHAYPDRLAGRRRPAQFQLRAGGGAWVRDTDPIANEPFIVAADLDGKRDRSRIRLAAGLDADAIAGVLAEQVDEVRRLEWDGGRDDLVERVERRLGGLRLGEAVRPAAPGPDASAALLARVRATRLAALGWSQASIRLRQRVDYLHHTLGAPWPNWSVEHLVATLDDWLAPYLAGATRRDHLERIDLVTVLRSLLPWPQGAELDTLAPDRLALANGRSVAIEYGDQAPSAHVRVQDLFGTSRHPTAGGHPIVLHLLSPADRPIQITSDLPGFWSGSWAAVRKELAGRYPKHQWPIDPVAADPRRLK